MSTETVLTCPHGHTGIRRNTGGFAHKPAKSEYYCESCRNLPHLYDTPHYERDDLLERAKRVNPDREYDVKLGYVWTPDRS